MNCTHPTGAPILDCCGEEVGDLPLYIYCSLQQHGHEYFKIIGPAAQWEIFLRYYQTTVFNAAAQAAGCTDGSYESVIHVKTGDETVTEVPPFVPSDDSWFIISDVDTGLPDPKHTVVWQNTFFGARTKTVETIYTNPNSSQMMIDRVNSVMSGKDFSGLDPNQSPGGFQFNRNAKVIDWEGNERITWAPYYGLLVRYLNSDENYNQKSSTAFQSAAEIGDRWFTMQKLRALPGSYSVKSYINAIPTQTGTLISSTDIIFEGTRAFDPPVWPDTGYWKQLQEQATARELVNYDVLMPLPP